jgi:hypothetical protein
MITALLLGSDNLPKFIAKDFEEFIPISSMKPTSERLRNTADGEIERWHESLKGECIRPGSAVAANKRREVQKGPVCATLLLVIGPERFRAAEESALSTSS